MGFFDKILKALDALPFVARICVWCFCRRSFQQWAYILYFNRGHHTVSKLSTKLWQQHCQDVHNCCTVGYKNNVKRWVFWNRKLLWPVTGNILSLLLKCSHPNGLTVSKPTFFNPGGPVVTCWFMMPHVTMGAQVAQVVSLEITSRKLFHLNCANSITRLWKRSSCMELN
jgi:hypothetical protein